MSFVTRSDGRRIGNPRLFQKAQKRLRRAQGRVARREKFSKRWKKAVRLVARIHRKVFNQRNDFQHKLSRKIVNNYGIIFVEDLNVKGLSRGRLAKSVHDAGWAAFFRKLSYKAESAGRRFASVHPRGTSQALPEWRSKSQTAFGSWACVPPLRIGHHARPGSGHGSTEARTEPSAANRGAGMLRLTEKPRLQPGEYVTRFPRSPAQVRGVYRRREKPRHKEWARGRYS